MSARPLRELAERFVVDEVRAQELPPSYNVAPTDAVYAVADRHGKRLLGTFRWGFVMPGVRDAAHVLRPINARAETLTRRPAFRDAFARRRCLLPADGFYEWHARPDRPKQPYFIHPRDGAVLALAGLWTTWRRGEDVLRTCAIVTTRANGVVRQLHERMPVILPAQHWDPWLDPDHHDVADLSALLVPAPEELLELQPVSTDVNSVRNNGPELIHPIRLP